MRGATRLFFQPLLQGEGVVCCWKKKSPLSAFIAGKNSYNLGGHFNSSLLWEPKDVGITWLH